ncbi:histidine kinase [Streptomyces sp. NPDC097610]|uniref:sensor histidine kinase n=1 Tax=Streptomyces sp. NPDC097610 TaxID=3157227 RepID=UPI0033173BA7
MNDRRLRARLGRAEASPRGSGGRSVVIGLLARTAARVRAADRRVPALWDSLVVAAFLLTGLPDVLAGPFQPSFLHIENPALPEATVLAMEATLTVPLWWRRRAPVAVTAVIASVSLGQWMQGTWLSSGIVILPALFNLALRTRPRGSVWAWGAVTAAFVAAGVRFDIGVPRVLALMGATTVALAAGLALRSSRMHILELEDRAERLRIEQRLGAEKAVTEERARMAREMHDIVGHNLSVIVGLADGAAHLAPTHPDRTAQAAHMIADSGRQALTELRRLVGVMRDPAQDGPELAPQPGLNDLPALADRVRAVGNPIHLRLPENTEGISPGLQLTVYRIVQEAVTNSLKHAAPGALVTVDIQYSGGALGITVSDRGPRRTDRGAVHPGDGHGLIGMRERAALFGGDVSAGPAPDGGWTLRADLYDNPIAFPHESESP